MRTAEAVVVKLAFVAGNSDCASFVSSDAEAVTVGQSPLCWKMPANLAALTELRLKQGRLIAAVSPDS